MARWFYALAALALCVLSTQATAQRGVFATAEQFYANAFDAEPEAKMLWLGGEQLDQAQQILGHRFAGIRVRYQAVGDRSAWILDEIGKTHPITFGVIVDNNTIAAVQVLEFRESRGGEVRYDSFTEQFIGGELKKNQSEPALDKHIDGITGATMSVRAMKKVATLALYFHTQAATVKTAGVAVKSFTP